MQANQATEGSYHWTCVFTDPGGHRFFRNEINGRIAIADQSGNYPHTTDDGVLYLDTNRPIVIRDRFAIIPVTGPRHGEAQTISNPHTALVVARRFGFEVRIEGKPAELLTDVLAAIRDGVPVEIGGAS